MKDYLDGILRCGQCWRFRHSFKAKQAPFARAAQLVTVEADALTDSDMVTMANEIIPNFCGINSKRPGG